ncbi:hypothetical protein M0R88_06390 [Halorussus gelatinilyticus]|uniref:Uncharacterized protein n=1 Tax=Halorussus gelatinilyticus TaxID=2937524 RepID=A0A8U0IM18_9EURY|nr:hypothetical protein [Halorussus gelatinilyticus]UPW01726.1 hypothetical protein M0R88_06390 [Halorussus gelatinilyticus]
MRPENRRGTPVDPVPFLVVAALGFLGCYSYGPAYLLTVGVELPAALALSTVAFLAATAVAYHRFVWLARPDLRGEVPPDLRLRRLFLGGLAVFGICALLALPLVEPLIRP